MGRLQKGRQGDTAVSKFKSLLDVAKNRDSTVSTKQGGRKRTATQTVPPVALGQGRLGRPAGKRSDPEYEQVTAYIRRETHKGVKIALLQEGQRREFSELVEDLLSSWLKART
jgi:hypothetical protein